MFLSWEFKNWDGLNPGALIEEVFFGVLFMLTLEINLELATGF